MVTLHNFADRRQTVALDPRCRGGDRLLDVFGEHHSRCDGDAHAIAIEPYGHRWYRAGAVDNTLSQTAF
jgi:maltose alpha-D-glucosyltransferase/alpha-amylase